VLVALDVVVEVLQDVVERQGLVDALQRVGRDGSQRDRADDAQGADRYACCSEGLLV
jgi:hypothetical protein